MFELAIRQNQKNAIKCVDKNEGSMEGQKEISGK